jgi:hypothetical protein
MVVLERADWQPLTEIMTTFRNEARMSISATRGHAELIKQIVLQNSKTPEWNAWASASWASRTSSPPTCSASRI